MTAITFHDASARKFRRRGVLLVAATVAAAAAALGGISLSDRGSATAWVAALVRVAETAPRLLVGAPGWNVTRADEFGVGKGEMTFGHGSGRLDLRWDRGADLGAKLGEAGSGAESLGTTTVDGAQHDCFATPAATTSSQRGLRTATASRHAASPPISLRSRRSSTRCTR
jgi:hypothetical protein